MKFHILYWLALVVVVLSCNESAVEEKKSNNNAPRIIKGEAQGTTYSISYFGSREIAKQGIDSLLRDIDMSMSNWVPNSKISRFNNGEDSVRLDWHFIRNLSASYIMNLETKGAFNPMVKSIVDYYGFGVKGTKISNIDTLKIEELIRYCSLDSLDLMFGDSIIDIEGVLYSVSMADTVLLLNKNTNYKLDFNAIAQGYSADAIAMHLLQQGAESYLIEIGGEMVTRGLKKDGSKWKIGIDRPKESANQRQIQATIELEDKGIATSGNYRKFYESNGIKYHHTINPLTGYPAKHKLLSATVIASNGSTADALATAFMVMGLEKSIDYLKTKNNGVQAFLIYSNDKGEYEYFISEKLKPNLELKN